MPLVWEAGAPVRELPDLKASLSFDRRFPSGTRDSTCCGPEDSHQQLEMRLWEFPGCRCQRAQEPREIWRYNCRRALLAVRTHRTVSVNEQYTFGNVTFENYVGRCCFNSNLQILAMDTRKQITVSCAAISDGSAWSIDSSQRWMETDMVSALRIVCCFCLSKDLKNLRQKNIRWQDDRTALTFRLIVPAWSILPFGVLRFTQHNIANIF